MGSVGMFWVSDCFIVLVNWDCWLFLYVGCVGESIGNDLLFVRGER